jgi:hypothetical protein
MTKPGVEEHLIPAETLDRLGAVVAQEKAMRGEVRLLPHGSRLYFVPAGWESAMIRKDPAVRGCETLLALEAAVQDPDAKVIFLPLGALMTETDIEKICRRNGAAKTLFKEVEK